MQEESCLLARKLDFIYFGNNKKQGKLRQTLDQEVANANLLGHCARPKEIFKTQALLCTDSKASAEQIIEWFVRRWQVEVTFHEVRTHLGVETQRQWADLSILRSTPACGVCFP